MNQNEFDRVLDSCLDRVVRGESIARCLSDHPQFVSRLEPLLRVARASHDACEFAPSAATMDLARARFRLAVARRDGTRACRRTPGLFDRVLARPLPLAALASFAVIALTILLVVLPLAPDTAGVDPTTAVPAQPTPPPTASPNVPPSDPTGPPSTSLPGDPASPDAPTEPPASPAIVTATPHPDGNFAFYVSDAPNDIADFTSLVVTIESIELRPRGGDHWVRITPTEAQTDLVQLQGDLAHELWRGDVPQGDYAAVFLSISEIEGVLKGNGATAEVTLPSDRLHIASGFSIKGNAVTDFVFDITVHRAGSSGPELHYILVPQAAESGMDQPFRAVKPRMSAAGNTNGRNQSDIEPPAKEDSDPNDGAPRPGPGPGVGHIWQETSFTTFP